MPWLGSGVRTVTGDARNTTVLASKGWSFSDGSSDGYSATESWKSVNVFYITYALGNNTVLEWSITHPHWQVRSASHFGSSSLFVHNNRPRFEAGVSDLWPLIFWYVGIFGFRAGVKRVGEAQPERTGIKVCSY